THDSSPSKIASSIIVVEEENTNNNDNNNEDDDDETSTEVAPAKPQKRRRAKFIQPTTSNTSIPSDLTNIVQAISTSRPGQNISNHNQIDNDNGIHNPPHVTLTNAQSEIFDPSDVIPTNYINVQPQLIPSWQPNTRLHKLHTQFQKTILYQHPCTPCAYCEKLLYPTKAKWIPYDNNTTYPIEEHYPHFELIIRNRNSELLISVCNKCKSKRKMITCLPLSPIPQEILSIPIMHRRFLSPVFLHCSLGRTTGENPFSEYRILSGDMRFSKNMRALKLYSGSIGAFLPTENQQTQNNSWCTNELRSAAEWLKIHNCYMRPYAEMLVTSSNGHSASSANPFPTATYSDHTQLNQNTLENAIIIQNSNFPSEIHNEDFHYTHLMAGFIKTSDSTTLPLSFNDPELEPLLFPDLFPDDGEMFFYQQLLCTIPCRTENELLANFPTYRDHYLHLNPHLNVMLQTSTNSRATYDQLFEVQFNNFVTDLINQLTTPISPKIADILQIQLNAMKLLPPILPTTAMLDLPTEQYKTINTITQCLGPVSNNKYPYFFITGSAGTG
ncbi:20181_t:CDS:2, partial [Gigaspora rosea]